MTWRGHLPLALSSYIKDRGRRELSVFHSMILCRVVFYRL